MTNRAKRAFVSTLLGLGTVASTVIVVPDGGLVAPNEAQAVIGRPLTPVSVAGVARRSVRRY
jgi:hypothetical protein